MGKTPEMRAANSSTKGQGRRPKKQQDLQSVILSTKVTKDELRRLDDYLEKMNINVRSVGIRKMLFDAIDAFEKQQSCKIAK